MIPTAARVAALYDIHGNLPALEAVLDDVRRESVDLIVVGGDVFPGPLAAESLACLLDLDIPVRFIHGNGDREIVAMAAGGDGAAVPEPHRSAMRWLADRLDPRHRSAMAEWPSTTRVEVDGLGAVLFCHATPRNDTEVFTRLTPDDRVAALFAGVDAALVVCGHTHMQFDRRIGDVRVVNAGSVGMPFGEPGACWLLLDGEPRLRRTDYDLQRAAERIRAAAFPRAGQFAAKYVLARPSEEEMLAVFEQGEKG